MNSNDINRSIHYIVEKCRDLKNKYIDEDFEIDYVCIFSHSQDEYSELIKQASLLGRIVDNTKTGPVFKFNRPPETILEKPKVIKIRFPDKTRPERGDVDFTTDYQRFKSKYVDNNGFKLIKRDKFEMLELKDDKFDVLVYFSSIPPSKLLGIK